MTTLRFSHHAPPDRVRRLLVYKVETKPITKFVNFIYMVLLLLETTCIDELSIELCGYNSRENLINANVIGENLRNWVVVAIAKNVKSFKLAKNVPMELLGRRPIQLDLQLPSCIFTCNSLEILELRKIVVKLNKTSSVRLPSLRILRMEDCIIDEDSIGEIVSGCSLLHTLYLSIISKNVFELSVCSPTLEHLTIIHKVLSTNYSFWDSYMDEVLSTNYTYRDRNMDDNEEGRINIDAPALKYLHLKQTKLKYLSIKTSSRLIAAEISLGAAKCEAGTFDDLIQSLSNVKVMGLDVSDAWLEVGAHSRLLPMFPNLTDLTVCNFSGEFNFVKELLQKSPTLETFGLKCVKLGSSNNFFVPNLIPRYRFPCLKMMKVEDFDGSIDQLKVLKYILLNARLLKTMKIMTHRECGSKRELLQEISMFRRRSKYCRIKFC